MQELVVCFLNSEIYYISIQGLIQDSSSALKCWSQMLQTDDIF